MTAKDEQAKEEVEAQATNPFNALCMEEDDESEDEETEETNDMHILPAHPGLRSPQHWTKKCIECENLSVGLMQCPTKGCKLNTMAIADTVEEQEEKTMKVDVSTITSSPDEDDLLTEDILKDAFQYDDNPTQVTTMHSKSHNSLENIIDLEDTLNGKIQPLYEADKVDMVKQHEGDNEEESSQISEEVERDDTFLNENTQAARAKNSVMTGEDTTEPKHIEERHLSCLEIVEAATQGAQPNQVHTSSEDEVGATPRKNNRTNTTQTKAQCQQAASKAASK